MFLFHVQNPHPLSQVYSFVPIPGAQQHKRPRRRYEEPPFPKLRRLLLNIASSTKLPQDEAIELAKYFGEHFDDERLRSDFFDVLVQL